MKITLISIVLFINTAFAQTISFDFTESEITERLQNDVSTLASDEMEGREAGTEVEKLVVKYIKECLKETDAKPLFEGSYLQYFDFYSEWHFTENNSLRIGHKAYRAEEHFYPMLESSDTSVTNIPVYTGYGIKHDEYDWNDYDTLKNLNGKIFVIEYYLPDELRERITLSQNDAIELKIETALEYNPEGILFVNSHNYGNPNINMRRSPQRWDIPIAFAGREVYEHLKAIDFDTEITMSVELGRDTLTGINVAGYINNGAENTIIIGAHHDHLGYGGPTSRHEGEPSIHYGADDNASGVAGVLETARYLSGSDFDKNNYILMTFSAEEKGLIGSRYFANSDAYDMNKVNYMLNFDMIGRMEENNLTILGTGTSPVWEELIKKLQPRHFNTTLIPSGVGRSDHSSFYAKGIPVLFFFTGIHEDYHDIGDTYDKINYKDQMEIIRFAWSLIEELNHSGKLEFTQTSAN